jgi:F0F1-type ATP synthase membrane subunit c/vacuolar-type H+-ATPase subunit K
MKYAFVVSAFFFIFVAIKIPVQPGPPVSQQFQFAIAFMGFMSIVAGVFVPQLISQVAERTARNNSAEAQLQRWMTKGILRLAFFEACVLFGLVVHFLHGSVWLVELLMGAGIAAELLWNPGEPPGAENAQG